MTISGTNASLRFGQMEIPLKSWSFEPMTKETDYSEFAALLGELDQPGIPDLLGGLSRHQLAEFPRIINAAREKGKADAYGKCVPPHIFMDLTNKFNDTESQLADANRERAKMSKVIAIQNGTADEIRKERNDAIAEAKRNYGLYESQRDDCMRKTSEVQRLQTELSAMKQKLDTSNGTAKMFADRNTVLTNKLCEKDSENQTLQNQLERAIEGRRICGKELDNAKEVARNNYAMFEAQKKENAELVANLQALQERNTELYKECREWQKLAESAAQQPKKDSVVYVPQPDLMPAFPADLPQGMQIRIKHAPEYVSRYMCTDEPCYIAICQPEAPMLDEHEYTRYYFTSPHWPEALGQVIRSASRLAK